MIQLLRPPLKRLVFRGAALAGLPRILVSRIAREGWACVLSFHRVSPEPNACWPPLAPGDFEYLIRYLRRHFELVTLDELARGGAAEGRPSAVVTFDDGYADFVDHALPVLRTYGVPVNLNLITSCLDSGAPPWETMVSDFLNVAAEETVHNLDLPGFDTTTFRASAEGRRRFTVALDRWLHRFPRAEREPLVAAIRAAADEVGSPATSMLRWDDARALAGEVHLGFHSHEHDSMGLEPMHRFESDLATGLARWEAELGGRPDTYAFPNGSYRPEHLSALERAGFRHTLLVEEAYAVPGACPAVPRFTVYGDSGPQALLMGLGLRGSGGWTGP